jgi:uncharacterized protein (DUF1330 family)
MFPPRNCIEEKPMPAYLVYVCQEVFDRAKLETYWQEIIPTLEGYGVGILTAYAPFEQLEGEPVEGVVVAEFPSRERAREWYDSEAYKAIRHFRIEGARYIGVLAEDGAPPIDERMPRTRSVRPAPS